MRGWRMKSCLAIPVLAVFAFYVLPECAAAAPAPASATCDITCTVADIAEWSSTTFPPINLPDLTTQDSQVSGCASLLLYTNGDVRITADNSDAAQLSKDDLNKLVTEYALEYDGSAVNQTGGNTVNYTHYHSFLSPDAIVKHVAGDGAVQVTLSVRVSAEDLQFPATGRYNATQTLTVCWSS